MIGSPLHHSADTYHSDRMQTTDNLKDDFEDFVDDVNASAVPSSASPRSSKSQLKSPESIELLSTKSQNQCKRAELACKKYRHNGCRTAKHTAAKLAASRKPSQNHTKFNAKPKHTGHILHHIRSITSIRDLLLAATSRECSVLCLAWPASRPLEPRRQRHRQQPNHNDDT